MNHQLRIHGPWLLITVATFVAGSQWARPDKSGAAAASVEVQAAGPSRSTWWAEAETRAGAEQGATLPAKSGRRERGEPKPVRRADGVGSVRALAAIPAVSKGMPLSKGQIGALVRTAVRGSTPVGRRRAFDRLLEEMQSGSFTVEQAMMTRWAMAENGASGEQWKLFDYAWGANDPAAAVAHLDEIPEEYRNRFLYNMIPGLASGDPQAAIAFFSGLDANLRFKVRNRLFEGLIDNDLVVATDYIYAATESAKRHDWRPMDIMTREIVKDKGLDNTLQWAEELPDGPLRGNAWSAAYAVWAVKEPQVAVQKIIELPPSPDRNQAINGFISALAHQDGEVAVAWAAEITNPGMREAAMVRAGKQYYKQDQQAALAWFNASGLQAAAWELVTNQR